MALFRIPPGGDEKQALIAFSCGLSETMVRHSFGISHPARTAAVLAVLPVARLLACPPGAPEFEAAGLGHLQAGKPTGGSGGGKTRRAGPDASATTSRWPDFPPDASIQIPSLRDWSRPAAC